MVLKNYKSFKKKIIYKKIRNHGVIAKSKRRIKLSKGKWISFLVLTYGLKINSKIIKFTKKKINVICNDSYC